MRGYAPAILLIAATYVIGTVAADRWTVSLLLFAQIGTVLYALWVSRARLQVRFVAALIFVLAVVSGLWNLITHDRALVGIVFLAGTLLYVIAPLAILSDLGRRLDVDRELLMGALSTYLMLGMAFAFAYRCLAAVEPGPFFGDQGDGTLAAALFYSFVTLTTTGYGDLVPAGVPGRTLAVLEALLGQLFLVTAVAKVVNVWSPRGGRDSHSPGMDHAGAATASVKPTDGSTEE